MKLKITLENKVYEVDVEAMEPEPEPLPNAGFLLQQPGAARVPAPAPVAAPKPAAGTETTASEDKVCRSPINGIVVKVAAQVGQSIQTGDTLLIVEAMKMETSITAPVAGKIAKINVAPSDAVQNGQVLVEFE